MDPLRKQLSEILNLLAQGLVERCPHVRLSLLAALSGEHSLLVGPPGTAKSELARRLHTAFRGTRYFERLLTRFSVPEELFGPLSIRALEEDRYERHTAGFLPDAAIAFIDEVFKANSAILNALLTLLNEREFDNGAGRQHCPLISVIGATNHIPEDEVAEAFLDRFLLRLPVEPVSEAGFADLLRTSVAPSGTAVPGLLALGADDLAAIATAAKAVALPDDVAATLSALREYCNAERIPVSDRRWVKIIHFLRVATATTGNGQISQWALLLLPCCTASDTAGQARVADWLTSRLGVRETFAPERLASVIEAFEAQLEAEQQANDLDYDESGRLKFSAGGAASEFSREFGDAKGSAAALRISYNRQRRYGETHIAARLGQIDAARTRISGYVTEVIALQANLAAFRADNLWLDESMLERVAANLEGTATAVGELRERLTSCRAGFLALPRLEVDDGHLPDPVDHEMLNAA